MRRRCRGPFARGSTNPQDFIHGDDARRFTGHPSAATLFQYNDRHMPCPPMPANDAEAIDTIAVTLFGFQPEF
jgi:hypothetical protein